MTAAHNSGSLSPYWQDLLQANSLPDKGSPLCESHDPPNKIFEIHFSMLLGHLEKALTAAACTAKLQPGADPSPRKGPGQISAQHLWS